MHRLMSDSIRSVRSAVDSGSDYHEVCPDKPLPHTEVSDIKRDLESLSFGVLGSINFGEGYRHDSTSKREAQQKAVATAPELDTVVQREARERALDQSAQSVFQRRHIA